MNNITPLTVERVDLAQAARESALLADLTISVWSAERTDRTATEELKHVKGATGQVGRFVKNMLAGADGKLKDVKSAFQAVRSLHYQLTLPWVADAHAERNTGPRLLPHLLFESYVEQISTKKREAVARLDEFLADYPALIETAKRNLGELADTSYPSVEDVRQAFSIKFDFSPIPAGASFKGLPDHWIEQLSKKMQAKQEAMLANANAAMWEQVRERVQHLVDRLADPDAKFKTSTVENVRSLIKLLPGWAITDDGRAREVALEIERMLDKVTAETIRDDATVRQHVADQAREVTNKLSEWGL